MLAREELARYARQMLLPGFGVAGQERLKGSSVLVVGAGGLGSPALLYLVAAGVGRVGVVDDDVVDASNLHRQVLHGSADLGRPKTESAAERLRELNPHVALEPLPARLTGDDAREVVSAYDVVLDGSDNFPTRYLVSDACVLAGKPLVFGALSRLDGQVGVLVRGSVGEAGAARDDRVACYRCAFPTPPAPGTVPSCAEAGVFGPLPAVVGSLMASEALKLLLGWEGVLAGRLLLVDLAAAATQSVALERDPACPACGDAPTITGPIDYEAFCGVTRD